MSSVLSTLATSVRRGCTPRKATVPASSAASGSSKVLQMSPLEPQPDADRQRDRHVADARRPDFVVEQVGAAVHPRDVRVGAAGQLDAPLDHGGRLEVGAEADADREGRPVVGVRNRLEARREGRQGRGRRGGGVARAAVVDDPQLEVVVRGRAQAAHGVTRRVGLPGGAVRNRGPVVGEGVVAGPVADLAGGDGHSLRRAVPQ